MSGAEDLARTESAAALAKKIRRKEVSPLEVLDTAIERIEAHNPKINALVIFGYDDARKAAKAAEAAIMRGDAVGPLHGVPIAMKDCFDYKPGWVTTFGGIRALKDYVVDTYCMFVERMEQAGAIFVGKTNSPVFGFRGTCDNYLFGPSKNPFDLTKNTGGSSGGSAGAVAAGLLPLCEGTDGGGSIRIPSSWCGVYGYKPSFGRVPLVTRPEAFGGNVPFIFEGPISRTVEDAALAMTVLAGYDSRDPYSIEGKVDFMAALSGSVAGKKIAYTRDYGIFPVDRRVVAVVDAAVAAFEEAGAHVEEVEIGLRRAQRELSDVWCRFIAPKQVAALEGFKREGIDLLPRPPRRFPAGVLALGRDRAAHDGDAIHRRPGDSHRSLRCAPQRARPLRLPGLADPRLPRRRQRDGRQHRRPGGDRGRVGRPADRLVHDVSDQLHRLSGGHGSRRAGGERPAGRHADRRQALRRCRRHRGKRGIRAAAAVDGHVSVV